MRCFAAVPNVVFAIPFCRRTLLVGALSVTLAGCACSAPPQVATDGCVSPGCLRRTAAVEAPLEVKPAPPLPAKPKSKPATAARTPKLTAVATKTEKPSSPQPSTSASTSEEKAESSKARTLQSAPSGQPSPVTTTTTVGTKVDAPVSGQPSEMSDSALKKAKATIAAKMENAAAVEFVDAKRAIRKNTLGQPIDTICGHVREKAIG
jgi:hypothetical protein